MEPIRSPHAPDPDPEADPPTSLDEAADARLEHADFANARVLGSRLRRVELHLCRLTGIELAEATWSDVVLTGCRIDFAGFRHAKLERVAFRDCRLEEAEFGGATLTDVVFDGCDLRRASFAGCRSERLELRGCSLNELVGIDALRGARMPWGDILENAPLFAQALGLQVLADE